MLKTILIWFKAIRPVSLWISAMPVFIATAMALGDGGVHIPSAIAALLGALLIHIGCNLTNDFWDFKRGSNQAGEIDPMSGLKAGTINQNNMKIACIVVFVLALLPCAYLFQRAGLPILVIAIISLLSAIFYTAGKRSLAYMGLGDIFAFLFFGPIAVAGTYYVQVQEMNTAIILAGFAPGFFSLAVLTINNIRDLEKDKQVNKKTLTVRLGKTFSFYEYLACVFAITLTPGAVYLVTHDHTLTLFASLTGFFGIPTMIKVLTAKEEMAYNVSLGETIKLLMAYSVIFSIGWQF